MSSVTVDQRTPRLGLLTRGDDRRDQKTLADTQAAYEQMLGCAVSIDDQARRITVKIDGHLSALAMPELLGTAVVHTLISTMQPAAVLASGRGGWLTFLPDPERSTPPCRSTPRPPMSSRNPTAPRLRYPCQAVAARTADGLFHRTAAPNFRHGP